MGQAPAHIAIIMDGNGRWATRRGLPRVEGHRQGAESVRDVVRTAREIGVRVLTLFAFSEQNWDRPEREVGSLMQLLYQYVLDEQSEIIDNRIRLNAVGELDRLPPFVRTPLEELMRTSAKKPYDMELCLALSYGGQEEIIAASRRIGARIASGELLPDQIDKTLFASELSSSQLPPVDLLIRTSGEQRISNFLIWHLAYAELCFTEIMWPDFRKDDLLRAIDLYQQRERRYGRTSDQLPTEPPT